MVCINTIYINIFLQHFQEIMTQLLFFDANSQTGKPIWRDSSLSILPSLWSKALYTALLSPCTAFKIMYFIMVNHRISPDLNLAELHLWDFGWDEIYIIQSLWV